MAINNARIQHLRGSYNNFDKSRALPGEFQVVVSDDPSVPSGKAVYIAFSAGDVRRLVSIEDIETMVADGQFKGEKGDTGDTGPVGPKGADGTVTFEALTDEQKASLKGASVSSASVNEAGQLILTLTDETELNAGNVIGPTGATGATGEKGDPGEKGDKGDTGEKGNTGATGPRGVGISSIAPNSNMVPGLKITFNSQSKTESVNWDYIQIFYEEDGAKKQVCKIGGTIGSQVFYVPSNVFWLYWHTDTSDDSYYGFKIDSIEPVIVDKTTVSGSSATFPSYTVTEASGENYPESAHGSYGNNVNQMWKYTGEIAIADSSYYTISLTNGTSYTIEIPNGAEGPQGQQGPQGPPGEKGNDGTSVNILGQKESESELPADAVRGDAYLISGHLWVYDGSGWNDAGEIKGPKGDKGDTGDTGPQGEPGATGADGKSAYASAQDGGYTGTESEFYADLAAVQNLAAELAAL